MPRFRTRLKAPSTHGSLFRGKEYGNGCTDVPSEGRLGGTKCNLREGIGKGRCNDMYGMKGKCNEG